jgi:hypothetical protein
MPEKASGDRQGTMRLTGAVNVVERGEGLRPISPQWDLSFKRKCRAQNLIGCDGDHVMLQCDKLLSLGLAERKDVLRGVGCAHSASSTRPSLNATAKEAYPSPGAHAAGVTGSTHPMCTC